MTRNQPTPEELKQELDRLNAEQHEEFADAIYLGMPPEKVKRMDARGARITALCDELYHLIRRES